MNEFAPEFTDRPHRRPRLFKLGLALLGINDDERQARHLRETQRERADGDLGLEMFLSAAEGQRAKARAGREAEQHDLSDLGVRKLEL